MSEQDVRRRWGDAKFDSGSFKRGDLTVRSTLAADLIEHRDGYLGKTAPEIRAELGDPDGFYFRDSFPAYFIDDKDGDAWQIVFLLNNEFKVEDIIVHRNCCE